MSHVDFLTTKKNIRKFYIPSHFERFRKRRFKTDYKKKNMIKQHYNPNCRKEANEKRSRKKVYLNKKTRPPRGRD